MLNMGNIKLSITMFVSTLRFMMSIEARIKPNKEKNVYMWR